MKFQQIRLDNICDINTGYTVRNRIDYFRSEGLPAIQLRDVTSDGVANPKDLVRICIENVSKRYIVRSGDIVFRSRGRRNQAFLLDERFSEPCLALLPLFILRPLKEIVDPAFLTWTINQPPAQIYFDSVAHGTNLRMVSRTDLARLMLELPEMDVQIKIVEVDFLSQREYVLSVCAARARRKLMKLKLSDCIGTASLDHL